MALVDRTTIEGSRGDVLEGRCDFRLGHNAGDAQARLILTFTPAGIEKFFEETLERALDPGRPVPDNIDEVAARYVVAAPRYGLEFLDG